MYTIEDIAKKTGLSIATVSRYYNGIKIREENRIILDKIAEQTGYKPNEYASTLKVKKTKVIGAIIPTIKDSFAMNVLSEVEAELKKYNYSLFIMDHMALNTGELECMNTLIQKRVNGIVYLPFTPFSDVPKIHKLTGQNGIPLVIFDLKIDDIDCDYVLFDNYGAGFKACEMLIHKGHKNIGIITGPTNLSTSRGRLEGILACLKEHQIPVNENNVFVDDTYSFESGYVSAKKLLSLTTRPTGIITTNYDFTLGAIRAANEAGLTVPDDISLVGIDYSETFKVFCPSVTAIEQPINIIGKEITETLMNKINNLNKKAEVKIVSYSVVNGNSIKNL